MLSTFGLLRWGNAREHVCCRTIVLKVCKVKWVIICYSIGLGGNWILLAYNFFGVLNVPLLRWGQGDIFLWLCQFRFMADFTWIWFCLGRISRHEGDFIDKKIEGDWFINYACLVLIWRVGIAIVCNLRQRYRMVIVESVKKRASTLKWSI